MPIDYDPADRSTLPSNSASNIFRVLDVGCGTGDSLHEELELRRNTMGESARIEMTGVDVNEQVLAQGSASNPQFLFVHAKGEHLPFPDQTFDAVISRVAICYMDIPVALREMRRVLKTGGELKLKLHPFTYTLEELRTEVSSGPLWRRLQHAIYRGYVIANGIALHVGGFNLHFPLARHRCESFQTKEGIRRALLAADFDRIEIPVWQTQTKWPHAGNCRASACRKN